MFWDKVSPLYDLFETIYNGKVYNGTGQKVAEYIDETDDVLECACGTGAISIYIAPKCRSLVATDFSSGMLKRAAKKCRNFDNARFLKADITDIQYEDEQFHKTVAGNVIHLLPDPEKALNELLRVTKPGGLVIIPTYINMTKKSSSFAVKCIEMLGADFKQQFDLDSYKRFFFDMGVKDVEYSLVEGRMPCAIAVIRK